MIDHFKDIQDATWLLWPLALKHEGIPHVEHSMRVAYSCYDIAEYMGEDSKAMWLVGCLHDVGKALVDPKLLAKTACWTESDATEMSRHVEDGYRLLRGRFDFTAQIIAKHHSFQNKPYPKEALPNIHDYSQKTLDKIDRYARYLAIADTWDALHRVNSASGGVALEPHEMRGKMTEMHRGYEGLLVSLWNNGVLK